MADARITLGAVDNTRAAFESVKGNLQGLHTGATAVLGALGSLGSVAVFASMIKGSIDAAAGLNDLSIQTGATVEALSALGEIGRLSDVTTEMIGSAMNKLAKNMAGATEESKGTGKAIEALGINFDAFSRLNPEEQMQAIAKAMDNSADGSGKAAVAMALYGKEGAAMLPFLKDLATAGDLQAIVTAEQAAQSDNFADNLTKLQVSGSAWTKELAMGMIPALDIGAQAFLDVTNGADGLRDGTRKLAADGSIKDWTKAGITGLSYLVDAAQYVIRAVKATGESIGAYAAAGVAYFSGIGEALKKVISGDFMGAVGSMKSGMDASKTIMTGLGASLINTFSEDTLGTKIRARMKEIEATGAAAEAVKPKLDFTNVLDKNGKAAKEGAKAAKELEKAYADLVKAAQALANAKNAEADGIEAWFQAEEKARLATVRAANDSVAAAQAEYDNYGKTKSQIAEVTLARLQDKLAGVNAGTEIAASIGLEIEAQQRLIDILQKGEVRDASVKAASDAAAEWKKTTDDLERGLTDSLFRAFESGKGFFSTLWDGIKNLFKTTALKLIINPVSGAISGALGLGGPANAATSGGGGLLSNLSSANSMYSLATTGYAGMLGSGVGSIFGATAGNAALATAVTGSASSGAAAALAASQAAGTATATSASMASMGSSIAAAAPYLLAAVAAVAVISSMLSKKDNRHGGGYAYNTATNASDYTGGPDKSFTGDKAASDAVTSVAVGINGLLKSLGSSVSIAQYHAASETSKKGRGGVMAGGMLSNGIAFGEDRLGSNYNGDYFETTSTQSPDAATAAANFATDLKQSIIQALQAAGDVPESIKKLVGGIDAEALSDADVTTLLGAINATVLGVEQFRSALGTIGLTEFADIAFDAASAIAAASGGFEPLMANLSSYYDTYSTEAEKAALVTGQITQALAAVGVAMPATRAEFKAQVEAALALGEAGAPAVAALLSVNQAFASVTPEIEAVATVVETVATTISDTMQALMSDRAGLDIELMRAQGDTTGADAAQYAIDTAGLTEAELGLFNYNAGIRQQITALNDATAAAQALAATNQTWTDQLDILTGKETERSIALRDTTDESTRSLMQQVWAQQDLKTATDTATAAAQALAATNQTWTDQLDILTGKETERSIALRDAGDDSTRALMRQVYAQQDLKTASEQAAQALAQAAQSAAQAVQAIASERAGLTRQLLQAQGDTAALRALDLAAIDPSNKALQEQIWAQEDLTAANAAAASAAQAAASASQSLRSAWESVTDTIFDEVRRIRGLTAGDGKMGFAQAQAQFAITTAQARANDQDAAKLLPGLSQAMLALAENNVGTLAELQFLRAQTAGSLQVTASMLAARQGLNVPAFAAGGDRAGGRAMVGEQGTELAYMPPARIYTAADTRSMQGGSQGNAELLAEIRQLNARIARMEVHAEKTRASSQLTAEVLDDASRLKRPLGTKAIA